MSSPPPVIGVVFDVEQSCKRFGSRYSRCKAPEKMVFRADSPSDSKGNKKIENLPFLNRLVVSFQGESNLPASVDVKLGNYSSDLAIGPGDEGQLVAERPTIYEGTDLILTPQGKYATIGQAFTDGTRIEVLVNFVYPDPKAIRIYAYSLSRLVHLLSEVFESLSPDVSSIEAIAAIESAVNLLAELSEDPILSQDPLTLGEVNEAKGRLSSSHQALKRICGGGSPAELCQEFVKITRDQIKDGLDPILKEYSDLGEFLQAEVRRLNDYNAAKIQTRLEEAIQFLK